MMHVCSDSMNTNECMKVKEKICNREIFCFISKAKTYKILIIYAILSALSLGGFLLASQLTYHPGFPLDDAWIHQTYARNLALHGEWSFTPGNQSAGSTSPGWTVILALGYLFSINPLAWAYLVGWVLLTSLAIFGALFYKHLSSRGSWVWIFAGALLIFEWHLVWAAASGMETALAALFPLFVLVMAFYTENRVLDDRSRRYLWLLSGLLIGISVWVRPEVISLVIVPGVLILKLRNHQQAGKAIIYTGIGLALPVLAYISMNQILGIGIWPNTFYAKQAEYEILKETPYFVRYLQQAQLPLVGPGIVLLPGFIWFVYTSFKGREWLRIAGIIWVSIFLGLFAWKLPVTYQHGRYIMPVMPVYLLMGVAGIESLLRRIPKNLQRKVALGFSALVIGVSGGFWVIGARSYAIDVAIIESEMVASSRWIRENTAPNAVIAAHDIGALGYFGERKIVDLAGLISPQVIPFISDEEQLADFIEAQNADYLMTFPGWYPKLIENGSMVFSSSGSFSPMVGGENMAVFRLKRK